MHPAAWIKGLVVLLAVLVAGVPAYSQEQPSQTPYEIHLKNDLPAVGAAGVAAILPAIYANHVKKECTCIISELNWLDRGTAARKNDTLDKVSAGAVVGAVAWPYAAMLLERGTRHDAITDGFITGEAVLVNVGINHVIKFAAHRPRPFLYAPSVDHDLVTANDSYVSFYSQHTSVVFAAGISYARTFALRHPQSRHKWVVYTAAIGGGAAVGTLRVLSGRHFPTDVITGAAAGTGVGLLIPKLHVKGTATALSIVPTRAGAAVSLRVPFG